MEALQSLKTTRSLLLTLIQNLHEKGGWPYSRIHLFGFSQGGAVALDLASQLRYMLSTSLLLHAKTLLLKVTGVRLPDCPMMSENWRVLVLQISGTCICRSPWYMIWKTSLIPAWQEQEDVGNCVFDSHLHLPAGGCPCLHVCKGFQLIVADRRASLWN